MCSRQKPCADNWPRRWCVRFRWITARVCLQILPKARHGRSSSQCIFSGSREVVSACRCEILYTVYFSPGRYTLVSSFVRSLSLALVQICLLLLCWQVMSQFATISSGKGDGSYPEPAATLVRALSVANLDILGFGACGWDCNCHPPPSLLTRDAPHSLQSRLAVFSVAPHFITRSPSKRAPHPVYSLCSHATL